MGLVFRWDPCGLVCCVLTYLAIFYADYVAIFWLLLPSFQDSLWGLVHIILFNVVLGFVAISHARAMVSDPGIVPFPKTQLDFSDMRGKNGRGGPQPSEDESDSDVAPPTQSFVGEDWSVCARCEAYRPPRAHHCRICRRCVRKMDHHCPWINNCVGELNQKFFLLFLLYVGVSSFYALGLVVVAWLWPPPGLDEQTKQQRLMHTIFLTIESTLFLLFVVAVSCDQVQAIVSDETAVEAVQRRGPHRAAKTKRALFKEVCGQGPLVLWLLPCHSLPGRRDFVHMPSSYPV